MTRSSSCLIASFSVEATSAEPVWNVLPRAARVGVGHGTRAECRRDRAGERERRGDGRPRGLAAQAE